MKIQARLSSDERAVLAALFDDPETGASIASDFASKPVDEVVALIRRGVPRRRSTTTTTEQLVREKLPAVLERVEPSDQARLIKLAPTLAQRRDSPEAQ